MRIARLILAALLATALPLASVADVAPGYIQPFAKTDMIAAANPHAAEAGLEMLRAGGSAVDAAIAAQMVLTLVEPESSGIGGGAFMMLYDPEDQDHHQLRRPRDGARLGHARHVPGCGRQAAPAFRRDPRRAFGRRARRRAMLAMAHQKYGKLPWAKLFEPAIKLARERLSGRARSSRAPSALSADDATMPDISATSIIRTARR